jgi:hypothetical protein
VEERRSLAYALRRPRFPVICSIDGYLIGAQSSAEFGRRLAHFDLSAPAEFTAIDAKGQKWMLLPDQMLLAPEFMIRPMRKIEIIRFFNESPYAQERGLRYPEQGLGNRRLDQIVHDIAARLGRNPGI